MYLYFKYFIMTKKEKQNEIKRLYSEQKKLYKKVVSIMKLPTPKREVTSIKRAQKSFKYLFIIRQLEIQKQIIISKPCFVSGGLVTIGEKSNEIITDRNGNIISNVKPIKFEDIDKTVDVSKIIQTK